MNVSEGLLLDTHVWLWMALNSPKITFHLRGLLSEAAEEGQLYVSAISLFEVANLVRTTASTLPCRCPPVSPFFAENDLVLLPLTPEVAVVTTLLPKDFHGDPGDRLIAATAQVYNLTLCTHDHALLRFGKQGIY